MKRVTKFVAALGVCLGLASSGWAQKGKGNSGGKGNPAAGTQSQTLPERANQGGDVRGEQRAEEVQEMNQTKKATHKGKKKAATTAGKAKGKAKSAEKTAQ